MSGLISILGDDAECFYDWGFKKGSYPSNQNKCLIPNGFTSKSYSGVIKNLKIGAYNVEGKSEIYFVNLSTTDRKDKHNQYRENYLPRIDINSLDFSNLLKNGDIRFNPADLLSSTKSRNKALTAMYKAVEITNNICDQSLKSNITQGLQNMDIQDAPIYNDLKGHKVTLKK